MHEKTITLDPAWCERYIRAARWPGGRPRCPNCGSRDLGEIATRRLLRCKRCRRQISPRLGTILESSPLGLDTWLAAMWLVAKRGPSLTSTALARVLGVQQPTAWRMLRRIRTAMTLRDQPPRRTRPLDDDIVRDAPPDLETLDRLVRRVLAVPKHEVEEQIASSAS